MARSLRTSWGKDYSLAALSGLLLVLAWPNALWPGFSVWTGWLAWVALVPFILVWRRTGWRGNFVFGWLLGFVYFLGILYWIRLVNKDTNVDNAIGWVFYSLCGGIYFGLFASTARAVKDRLGGPDSLILPLAWAAWEYLRGHIFLDGWPWGSLGHTQYANPVIRQLAVVAGVGGVSFALVWVNSLLANLVPALWRNRPEGEPRHSLRIPGWKSLRDLMKTKPLPGVMAVSLLVLWAAIIGITLLDAWTFARKTGSPLHLALVQGNLNTDQVWNRAYRRRAMDRMRELHVRAASARPDLIIWSESCFPAILEYDLDAEWEEELRALIRANGVATLLTSNEYQKTYNLEGKAYHHYNSVFLLSGEAETLGRYRKIILVPGGEYIPWRWMDSFLQAVVREPIPVDFEPGTEYTVLELDGFRFSPLVCYEDQFEELGFRLAANGARFFCSLSNDGWAGRSAMSTQHAAMSVFLAVEHRAYMLKAGMTGPTLTIDPWGNMTKPMAYFIPGVKFESIAPKEHTTFFTRYGNVIPFFFLLLFSTLLTVALVFPARP